MDRRTLIIIFAGIIIIICLVFGLNSTDNKNVISNNGEEQIVKNLSYNEVIDNTTGETYYQIYDTETGEVMRNVIDEASLQIYLDNPDFIGPENQDSSESTIEYNEDGSIETNDIIQ